jgi:hypothetical protein
MSSRGPGDTQTAVYEILVGAVLSEQLVADLGAQRVAAPRGKTLLVLEIIDQSHLHGVLERLRDLNVDIESVNSAPGIEAGA